MHFERPPLAVGGQDLWEHLGSSAMLLAAGIGLLILVIAAIGMLALSPSTAWWIVFGVGGFMLAGGLAGAWANRGLAV